MIIKFTRNLKDYDLDVIGFYKKGKAGQLNEDNIRLVVSTVAWYPGTLRNCLLVPKDPIFTAADAMFLNSPNMMSGILGRDGPEGMGDLEFILDNISMPLPAQLKFKNYNYYLLSNNDPAIVPVVNSLFSKYKFFSNNSPI